MRALTNAELKQTNGGCIACALIELQRQLDAIEQLGNLTGSSDDYHN